MPRCGYLEGKVFEIEGFDIQFTFNGQNVRSDKQIAGNYTYVRAAPDSWTVNEWIENRFKPHFPGFGVNVLMADGNTASGQTKLRTVRASYPDDGK